MIFPMAEGHVMIDSHLNARKQNVLHVQCAPVRARTRHIFIEVEGIEGDEVLNE